MNQQGKVKDRLSIDRIAIWAIVVVFVITALVFAWSSANYRSDGLTRDTWTDDNGHVHVLGIELGETRLRKAEATLKSRSDIALYLYPDTHKKAGIRLEAYFPSINDHSKVILELAAGPALVAEIQQKGTVPHLYPNDVVRINLYPKAIAAAQRLIVSELTLIPSIDITADMLASRFGVASGSSTDADGFTRYIFPDIGLEATLHDGNPALLHFSNPKKSLLRP